MLFLDGVGIGRKDSDTNPFFAAPLPAFRSLFQGEFPSLHYRQLSSRRATVVPLDATLGVEGLPQSGTGQTALFTGINASQLIGKHFGPHPYSTLKPILEERSIFRRLMDAGKTVCFANAFPKRFFDYIAQRRSRLTATTLSCQYAGIPLLDAADLSAGRGISADITNAGWHGLGYPTMDVIEPAEAGRRLAMLTHRFDFVLFEYWRPDHAGHAQSMHDALDVLGKLDAMLVGILERLDTRDTLLVMTSDHGNIEDLSVKTHTRNPVPLILYGHRHGEFAARCSAPHPGHADLCRVTPAVLDLFGVAP